MFVDHPVGTGWSYGSQVPTNLNEIADDFLGFLLNFYKEHPYLMRRELVLSGESFAGKYLSYISQAILNYNELQTSEDTRIILKNLILSNPLVDVETERMHQHHLGFAIGLYDESQSPQVESLRRHCEESINDST